MDFVPFEHNPSIAVLPLSCGLSFLTLITSSFESRYSSSVIELLQHLLLRNSHHNQLIITHFCVDTGPYPIPISSPNLVPPQVALEFRSALFSWLSDAPLTRSRAIDGLCALSLSLGLSYWTRSRPIYYKGLCPSFTRIL